MMTFSRTFGHPEAAARLRGVSAVAAMCLLAACGTTEAPGPLVPGDQGRVRFVNLINDPARLPVNAILESVPFGVNLAYTGSTPSSLPAPSTAPYDAILAGPRSLVVQRTAAPNDVLGTINFTVAAGQDNTIYATGGAGGGAITNVITTDVNTAASATETRLRVANLSPAAGAVDVFITAAGADLTGATPDAAGLAVNTASAYISKAPGTYTVRFVPAGTAAASRNGAVTLTLAATSFGAGTNRTVVAADRPQGGAPLQAFVLVDR